MKLINLLFIFLIAIITLLCLPASTAEAGWVGSNCSGVSMTPQSGNVGTQAIISITYSNPQSADNFKILWSQSQLYRDYETKVIKEGMIPGGATSVIAQLNIPESRYGIHFIRFKRDGGEEINFQFMVLPELKIIPTSAISDATVSLRGSGFPDNDVILFQIGSKYLDMSIITNDSGSLTGQFIVPDLSAGKYKLIARSQTISVSSSTAIQILPPVDNNGNGNQQNQNQTNTVTTNSNDVNASTIEPENETIILPTPVPISPAGDWIGEIGSQAVTIHWDSGNKSNMNNFTYILEVNTVHDFSSGSVLLESGLTNTYYETVLEPGTYYWRVKAVDQAGNESYWAYAPYAFRVSEGSITINQFKEIIKDNSALITLAVVAIVSFIILSALASFILSMIRPRE